MAQDDKISVAYVAYSTFNTALDTLKQGIPPKIDRSVFRGQSGGTQAQLMAAFRALGLINEDNVPNPILPRLVEEATRKAALKEVLQRSYKDIIDLGLSNATEKQFNDGFMAYHLNGATLRKAKAFFLKAADDVGITLSPHIAVKASSSTKSVAARRVRRVARKPVEAQAVERVESPGFSTKLDLLSSGTVTLILDFNPLTISEVDRKFVFELVDKVKGYNRKAEAKAPAD